MPTIEIVSLNAEKPFIDEDQYDFAIIEETHLVSHRALFSDFLASKNGIMLHLGNPDFRYEKDGPFFGSELINWDFEPTQIQLPNFDLGETGAGQSARFQFDSKYRKSLENLLSQIIQASPVGTGYFYTDYQFGEAQASFKTTGIQQFWKEHDEIGLFRNKLYSIITPG